MKTEYNIKVDETLAERLFRYIVKYKSYDKLRKYSYKFNRDEITSYFVYIGVLEKENRQYNYEFSRAYLIHFKNKGLISRPEKHVNKSTSFQSYFEYRFLTNKGIEYAKQLKLI